MAGARDQNREVPALSLRKSHGRKQKDLGGWNCTGRYMEQLAEGVRRGLGQIIAGAASDKDPLDLCGMKAVCKMLETGLLERFEAALPYGRLIVNLTKCCDVVGHLQVEPFWRKLTPEIDAFIVAFKDNKK
jgi:hypothetical protein